MVDKIVPAALSPLRAALQRILDDSDPCGCEHDDDNCCALKADYCCPMCIAAVALRTSAALSPTELELNAWRELGEEMGRVISLMSAETFADWFPDWFGPRLFDLQVGAKPSATLSPSEEPKK